MGYDFAKSNYTAKAAKVEADAAPVSAGWKALHVIGSVAGMFVGVMVVRVLFGG